MGVHKLATHGRVTRAHWLTCCKQARVDKWFEDRMKKKEQQQGEKEDNAGQANAAAEKAAATGRKALTSKQRPRQELF